MIKNTLAASKMGYVALAMLAAVLFTTTLMGVAHAATGTLTSNQTVANVSEVKASRTLTVNALPVATESITIGSCVVTFSTTAGSTVDDTDCTGNVAGIDTNLGAGNTNRTAAEVAAVLRSLTNVGGGAHGTLAVTGTTTTAVFTTAGTEASATPITFTDSTTGDITSTSSTTGVVPVAQQVTFTPANPVESDEFGVRINTTLYRYSGGDTVAEVTAGLTATVTTDPAVNCTDGTTLVTCTAVSAGTAFTYDTQVQTVGSTGGGTGGGGNSNSDDDEDEAEDAISDARDSLDEARDEVADADEDDGDVDEAEDLLDEAEALLDDADEAFDDEDYDDVMDLVEEAEDLIDEALNEVGIESQSDEDETEEALDDARSDLSDARDEVEAADDDGDDIGDADELLDDAADALNDAEDSFDDEEYDDAMDFIDEANDLIDEALAEIGSSNDEDEDNDEDDTDSSDDKAELLADLMKQLAALQAQMGVPAASATFTMDLTIGSEGAEVTALQNWLIAKGHAIAAGATGYFGAQTQAALAAYQAANGISPAAGYFGAVTRAHVNAK